MAFLLIADVNEEEEDLQEFITSEGSLDVVEIMESPSKVDKGKGIIIPESSRSRELASEAAVEAIREFVQLKVRRIGPSSSASLRPRCRRHSRGLTTI